MIPVKVDPVFVAAVVRCAIRHETRLGAGAVAEFDHAIVGRAAVGRFFHDPGGPGGRERKREAAAGHHAAGQLAGDGEGIVVHHERGGDGDGRGCHERREGEYEGGEQGFHGSFPQNDFFTWNET